MGKTRVYVEVGDKRAFASAASWPGWCRSGRDEQSALANLAAYAPRYAAVSKLARLELAGDATGFEVVERQRGDATTDFGAPHIPAAGERKTLTGLETERMVALMDACWKYLDQVRGRVPQELRKGPRGGGRDRDKMWQHVLAAESMYASAIGVRVKEPDGMDAAAVKAFRKTLREGFADPNRDTRWPVPYAVRRTAWHALDHAWEMEDRLP